jgi:hypothetical protein
MRAQKISTHVSDGLGRLAEQYKNRPLIKAIHSSNYEQIQLLEDAIFEIDAGRQLWNGTSSPAVGQQLDNLGVIVGISRNGLPDSQYLLFLFGQIAQNFSDTSLSDIGTVVGYLFQADLIIIEELPPAGILVEAYGSNIPKSLFSLAKNLVKGAMGGGVELVFASANNNLGNFRFSGARTNASNGFSSVNNPSQGGKFVTTI